MGAKTEQIKALLGDIRLDDQRYQQLAELLELQHSAMISCDSLQMAELNQQLLASYQQLQGSAQRRVTILKTLGLPERDEGMRQLLNALPQGLSAQAMEWWQKLEQQTQRCQHLNSRNGRLLHAQQEIFAGLINNNSATNFLYAE
ncbi:FlgN protein [Izhakiella capsodis]|uniref:FlgN protein n=1 Tax=Izhakiella capsodis TaxID=1367852 RepID=A0A1I4YCR3_9GAMM|nr:flagellar protein FlgN [Izhakiella capsodis]SFN35359.1 FlgN protein [Izhakiella capsodis]